MIKVIYKNNNITISGHAGYKYAGEDIVCASVSSIVYTTINGILNINDKALKVTDNKGVFNIDILESDNITEKLIKSMLDLLKELQRQYPDKIKLSKGE